MSDSQNLHTDTGPGTFYILRVVIFIAAIIATLFIAWTEPGLLPSGLTEQFNQTVRQQQATQLLAASTTTAQPKQRIGIIAGHTGNDTGAICPKELGGIREVDLNLDAANRVIKALTQEGYDVDLLQEFDQRLNGYRGLALLSIHSDSCEYVNDEATGFKVAGSMLSKYPDESTRLAACIRSHYAETTKLPFHAGSITVNMTEYHAFTTVDPETPAAIIEIGFMNLDNQFLREHMDRIAAGITEGILCYVRNDSIPPDQTPTPTP
jgi:N-acetylmuramoyl-L-alanine amidase